MGITELADLVRARSTADEARAECIHDLSCSELAYDGTCDCGWPARVLAEVASRRQLLDEALGWEHESVSTREETLYCGSVERPGEWPCDCGRDARVLAVLTHLAQPYLETT